MRGKGLELHPGDFAENITTEGIDLSKMPVGTTLVVGDEVVLEMSQIGKECHAGCAIREMIGDCIMPREGIFAKVIKGGRVKAGDAIKVEKKKAKKA
jgi:MOSC domain-containing protein YiiM